MSLTFSDKKFYVISYDITDDRRRNRVMKLLKGSGFHVQKSVFECILTDAQLQKLLKLLESKIEPETDSIRVYSLCGDCRRQIRVMGRGEVSEVETVTIV